jgi:hypothetical protein
MEQDTVGVAKNTFKIGAMAALALVTSTVTALGVLMFLRTKRNARIEREADWKADETFVQPAVGTSISAKAPHHFSEELVVPGVTRTGVEIELEDAQDGRSPEGV